MSTCQSDNIPECRQYRQHHVKYDIALTRWLFFSLTIFKFIKILTIFKFNSSRMMPFVVALINNTLLGLSFYFVTCTGITVLERPRPDRRIWKQGVIVYTRKITLIWIQSQVQTKNTSLKQRYCFHCNIFPKAYFRTIIKNYQIT